MQNSTRDTLKLLFSKSELNQLEVLRSIDAADGLID